MVYAQKGIAEIEYAGHTIQVPEGCIAKSENEFYCGSISTQWSYLDFENSDVIPQQTAKQYESDPSYENKTEIIFKSFDSELKGFKIEFLKNGRQIYLIVVSGTVNDKTILMNISSMKDINENSDLNELQKQIISLE